VKTETGALKKEIKDKTEISVSAMETKINAGQEELRCEVSAFQDKISATQDEIEERIADTLEEQLKGVTTRVEQEAKILGMSSFARCK
jgi:hypothetical protein